MEKKYIFNRIGDTDLGSLFVDKEHQAIMFYGNKKKFIRKIRKCVKGSIFEGEIIWDLFEFFNLFEEITEQEFLEKGYYITAYSDKTGKYRIEVSLPSEEPISSVSKTVLRTYKLQA
jgi:hypothetical protein